MKEVWICRWEVIPGNGEQTEQFPNLAAAKQAMRQKIADCIDLQDYIADLEPQVADFLGRFLSDPQFPQSKNDIPDDYEDPEYGELYLGAGAIDWEYPYDAYPRLHTNMVLASVEHEDCHFDFWYECPEEAISNGVKALSISISPRMDYGTSAYPLMVLCALRKYPQTQEQIMRMIYDIWDTTIDRKAVGRHLQLLQDMGLPVQHGPDGYYYGGEACEPKSDIKYGPSAYPLMICKVLNGTPKTQTVIIQAVQEKYGTKIDRKAVSRHLELLGALGFRVRKGKDGYYLGEAI